MTPHHLLKRFHHARTGVALGLLLLGCLVGQAQSPSEHASHHPGAAAPGADAMPPTATPNNPTAPAAGGMAPMPAVPAPGAAAAAPAGMGDMQKMMGDMMGKAAMPAPASGSPAVPGTTPLGATAAPTGGTSAGGEKEGGAAGCCGGASGKPIYPFLMSLPELTPQNRTEIERLGQERIDAGAMLMENAREGLSNALQAGDHAAAERSLQQIREGSAELASGIAAHRVLRDGVPPQLAALAWFKTDMGLSPPTLPPGSENPAGVSIFHLFAMALLIIFAFVMLAIYFLKMRRATSLFGRVAPDDKSPAPGAAPALAGAAPK